MVSSLVMSLINERKREEMSVSENVVILNFTYNENLVPGNKKQSAQYTKTILIYFILLLTTINKANSKVNACLDKIHCNQSHRIFKTGKCFLTNWRQNQPYKIKTNTNLEPANIMKFRIIWKISINDFISFLYSIKSLLWMAMYCN